MNHIQLLALKPQEKKYAEPCGKGLSLIIYPSGRKVWTFHGRIDGKVITKALGDFPEFSEKAARAAIDALTMTQASATTADILAKMYAVKIANGRILERLANEHQRTFKKRLPALAAMRIDEINAPLAIAHLKPLSESTQTVAQKMAQILKECEVFAVNTGIKKDLCLQGISVYFPSARSGMKHQKSCEPSEFGKILATLSSSKHFDLCLFGIYTLLRASEIVAARREWVNLSTMSLDVPAEAMKMKRAHRVPITRQLADLLERLPQNGWLFPSPVCGGATHITKKTLEMQYKPVSDMCVPHGVRSVGRTYMSEIGAPFDVAEACLAHVRGNAVSRAYDRADLLEERRAVMQSWCDFVDGKI